MTIRLARAEDAGAVAAVYRPFVTDSVISFENAPPDEAEMRSRIASGGPLYPWLTAWDDAGVLLGFASASAFRARHAYRFTVETSVYLAPSAQGQGLGRRLYGRLLNVLEAQGFTQAIAAISLPNAPSVALHEKLGFEAAGLYRDVGFKLGAWRSVGLWQRPLAPAPQSPPEPKPFRDVWKG
ncbi:MAG TPA: GNAT family N-acetyltransferase [Allosphingosinicella sp.]|nr:GNAT family N-acetyltransferase [Allosphingosinicella sp.]